MCIVRSLSFRGDCHLIAVLYLVRVFQRAEMNSSSPARLLAIYGGTTFLVYIETNGFTKVRLRFFVFFEFDFFLWI